MLTLPMSLTDGWKRIITGEKQSKLNIFILETSWFPSAAGIGIYDHE